MIIAATGHRPEKLGGYGPAAEAKRLAFALKLLTGSTVDKLISGMALGWDTAVAEAAVCLGIPFIAAVPFAGQERRWSYADQMKYRGLLERAEQTHVVSAGDYAASKMFKRNEWMVDNCEGVLALWDGSTGGTMACVRYAESVGRPVENLYTAWQDYAK